MFGSPQIGEEEIKEVVNSMRSGWLGTGQKVAIFDIKFTLKITVRKVREI